MKRLLNLNRIKLTYTAFRYHPTVINVVNSIRYVIHYPTMRRLRKGGALRRRLLSESQLHMSSLKSLGQPAPEARRIVSAANRYGDIVVVGVRHTCPQMRSSFQSLGGLSLLRLYAWRHGSVPEQGFIDNYHAFHTRESAMAIARARGQFFGSESPSTKASRLYSEHLH